MVMNKDRLFNAYIGLRFDGMTPEELRMLFRRKHIKIFEALFVKYWGGAILTA